jgi:hypothetical protein
MVTQQRLKEVLDYNPETGEFTWKERGQGRIVGKRAGTLSVSKTSMRRWFLCVDRQVMLRSRAAWIYMTGEDITGKVIDHINRNTEDDRFKNLRSCTQNQNMKNRKANSNSATGVKGVFYNKAKNKWGVSLGKNTGLFKTIDEAAIAYNKVAKELYGEFAYQNPIGLNT